MNKDSRIAILGASGLVGSAIVRELNAQQYTNLLTPTSAQLNLTIQEDVYYWFEENKPEYVYMCAGVVGGIKANSDFPVDFIYDNILMNANVIDSSCASEIKKLLILGSSCIYPKFSPQPIKEEYLLSGELEPTNEPYAIAKIAALKMVEAYRKQFDCNFISCMPTNLFGINDNYDLQTSHVLPAILKKMHEAKVKDTPSVTIWGSGNPRREFLYSSDMASAAIFLMERYDDMGHINVGTGEDISIRGLVELVADVVGYKGDVIYDTTKPDGTPQKLLDVSKIRSMGWQPMFNMKDAVELTYKDFLVNHAEYNI